MDFHQLGFAVAQSVHDEALSWIVVLFPTEGRDFLFSTVSRPAPGPFQPPIQWVPRYLLLGVMRPNREADYSPPSGDQVNNGNCTSTFAICLHRVEKINLFACVIGGRTSTVAGNTHVFGNTLFESREAHSLP